MTDGVEATMRVPAGRRSASVLIPMLNEAEAIGATVAQLSVLRDRGVLDEILVADGGSTDGSAALAAEAGATVIDTTAIRPDLGPVAGKGDTVWRAAHELRTDVVVLLDADLSGSLSAAVEAMAAAVRGRAEPILAKGFFLRVDDHGVPTPWSGGRVSEILARPLLRCVAPELAELRSPLSGQLALPVSELRSLPICTGYGIEIAMLVDWVARHGQASIVEVDLGAIRNSANDVPKLESMAVEVAAGLLHRADLLGMSVPGAFPPPGCPVVVRPPVDAADQPVERVEGLRASDRAVR